MVVSYWGGCRLLTFVSPTSSSSNSTSININNSRRRIKIKLSTQSTINKSTISSTSNCSLNVLEWDKLCDSVASFATTSLGRHATKAQLWNLNPSYEESLKLLDETNAAVQIRNHGSCSLDFTCVDALLVTAAIQHAYKALPLEGSEAIAVAALLDRADSLHLNLKAAVKEDQDWYTRFTPLTQLIMEMPINRSLVKSIHQVVEEDGSVKDSASPTLKKSRDQVRTLERKLYQLMDSLVRTEMEETSSMEVSNIDGRWCIRSGADQLTNFPGLLLSSGSGVGSIVEPLSAVPLNDELQQARAAVVKAEADVLLMLTKKMQPDLDDIRKLLESFIKLDVINARAAYGLAFGGNCPDLFLTQKKDDSFSAMADLSGNKASTTSNPTKAHEWTLYLPKAYHPLLLQQHRLNLQKARKNVSHAITEIRRRKLLGENVSPRGESDIDLPSLKTQVTKLEHDPPVPVDFYIARKTRVLVITGPNTGGKTICLKTVGLAAMMAKSGLYVLASEPVRIPWFDSVFTDIGDEQSLSQSLSTFSGHLKQISDIQSQSTSQSLILLDEVGAGTNPLEGAALGMSILECFAESGALLTIATTHHGELKTLKYSSDVFENACMEFDEVNLKPTYKILWGVPGRSNAINVAERLGLPAVVVDHARELYGVASAEINEESRSSSKNCANHVGINVNDTVSAKVVDTLIIDMERSKQEFQEHVNEGHHHLMLSRDLHENLLLTRRKIIEHNTDQRYKKMREISEYSAMARSILHKKVRQLRATVKQPSSFTTPNKSQQQTSNDTSTSSKTNNNAFPVEANQLSSTGKGSEIPKVGDVVHVSSLGKKASVLRVEPSKEEILVQVGNMKLKLKLADIET